MTTQKRTAGFRPWVWAAVAPGLFTLLAVVTGVPALIVAWIAITGGVVFLAWRGRTTPWWSVVGWVVCAVGVVLVIGAAAWDESPVVGATLAAIGAALGVGGLIVNGMKREVSHPSPVEPS